MCPSFTRLLSLVDLTLLVDAGLAFWPLLSVVTLCADGAIAFKLFSELLLLLLDLNCPCYILTRIATHFVVELSVFSDDLAGFRSIGIFF